MIINVRNFYNTNLVKGYYIKKKNFFFFFFKKKTNKGR
jgi:hypothetical protein